jgi:uncharacterized alpha-E superfamily protein
MLSRVANSLYWISRYIERAENVARVVDVNLQLLLDFQHLDDKRLKEHWDPIIRTMGSEDLFYKHYKEANSQTVTEFLTFQTENPGSILSCLFLARENARMVRDQVSTEMWEEINRMYLFLKSTSARKVWKSGPSEFYKQIRESSHLFQGLTDATVPHSEGWEFMQVGKYLERADMTTRILDVKYHILLPNPQDVGGTVDTIQWVAVLRSCSAFEAYHSIYVADVEPWKVAEFLTLSEEFPRSIRFCVKSLDAALRRISGIATGHFSNQAEKLSGRLLSELNFSSIDDIFKVGLHEYMDGLQNRFNEIGNGLQETYMFYPTTDLEEEIELQLASNEQKQG